MDVLITVAIVLASQATPISETLEVGWAARTNVGSLSGDVAFYNDGLMERVALNRGLIDSIDDYNGWLSSNGYIGAVAAYRNGDKWRSVYIMWPDGSIDGPYFCIDVVSRGHYKLGLDRNRVLDVEYGIAKRHDILNGPRPIKVVFADTITEAMGTMRVPE